LKAAIQFFSLPDLRSYLLTSEFNFINTKKRSEFGAGNKKKYFSPVASTIAESFYQLNGIDYY